jgi:serine protease Do
MISRPIVLLLIVLNVILLGVVLFQHALLGKNWATGTGSNTIGARVPATSAVTVQAAGLQAFDAPGRRTEAADARTTENRATATVMDSVLALDSAQNPIVQATLKASPAAVAVGGRISRVTYYVDPFFEQFFWPYFGQPGRQERIEVPFLGSGALIDDKGHIVTNVHVIEQVETPFVTLSDGRRIAAKLLDKDNRVDVALLKADLDKAPFLPMGNSDNLLPGEWVLAVGNPFGEAIPDPRPTVTLGVVSALHRNYKATDIERERIYLDMIQTDAAINPGNSGGPLVNIRAEVVGINTFIVSRGGGSVGIGFAIPINRVRAVVDEILRHGRVRNYMMDFEVVDLTAQLARKLGATAGTWGAVVSTIKDPNGPAAKAGLQPGDVIIRADRLRITTANDLLNYYLSLYVGARIEFRVVRNGQERTLQYTIQEYKK